jgi:hypothetical protein
VKLYSHFVPSEQIVIKQNERQEEEYLFPYQMVTTAAMLR